MGGLSVARVLLDLALIHRPRVRAAGARPCLAAVIGAIGAAARGMLDRCQQHARIRLRNREANASLVALGDAVGELLPRRAAVGRLVDAAPRAAAVATPRLAQVLVPRG